VLQAGVERLERFGKAVQFEEGLGAQAVGPHVLRLEGHGGIVIAYRGLVVLAPVQDAPALQVVLGDLRVIRE
jgi:hypothetical protein